VNFFICFNVEHEHEFLKSLLGEQDNKIVKGTRDS